MYCSAGHLKNNQNQFSHETLRADQQFPVGPVENYQVRQVKEHTD